MVKANILICEEDVETVRHMQGVLVEEGYHVETVSDTSEAIEMILGKKFNALILEVPGKDMSGYKAIPIINKIDLRLPIITITDDESLETQRRVRDGKIFYYLLKPIDSAEIKEVLKDAIKSGEK